MEGLYSTCSGVLADLGCSCGNYLLCLSLPGPLFSATITIALITKAGGTQQCTGGEHDPGPRCAFPELSAQALFKCHGIKPELQWKVSAWPSQDLTFASCRGRGCRPELQKVGRSISAGHI